MSTTTDHETTQTTEGTNLVVLHGHVRGVPVPRPLPGGAVAVQFDVGTVAVVDGAERRCSVPVNWVDPPTADAEMLTDGLGVLVVGTVQRRFFRVGGQTQSRTEVVPSRVIPSRRRASVRRALADAAAGLI
ncbi:MAG: hypothetical protein AAGG08_19695 [Actinomycetota bacterium]